MREDGPSFTARGVAYARSFLDRPATRDGDDELMAFLPDEHAVDPHDRLEETAQRLDLQRALQALTPRQRYVVTPLTLRHVNELFAVRALLEPHAARDAAGRIDAEHLRRLLLHP